MKDTAKFMQGMRSHLIRDRLRLFARTQHARTLEIISYDIPGRERKTSVEIARFVFGTRTKAQVRGGDVKEYRYPGFIEKEGVVWLGQSVFLLTPQRSRELREFLSGKGVAYGQLDVRIASSVLKDAAKRGGQVARRFA